MQDLLENGLGVMVAPGETSHVMPIGLYRRSQEVAVSFGVKVRVRVKGRDRVNVEENDRFRVLD